KGRLNGNLDVDSTTVASTKIVSLPSENLATTNYTYKSRQVDLSGSSDIYYTKLTDNVWEVSVYQDRSGVSTGFTYDLSDPDVHFATTTLTFDPTTGAIIRGDQILQPDPTDSFKIDFSGLRQGGAATAARF